MENQRVIVVSHMFPNNISHVSGIFVSEQVKALKSMASNEIVVVSPVPYSPRLLWFKRKWRDYGQICKGYNEEGIQVIYPRYIVLPGAQLFFLQGFTMFVTLLLTLKRLVKRKERFIIHCHTILPDGLAVALLRKIYPNMTSVCTIHGSDINIYPHRTRMTMKYTRYALCRHNRIITVSNALKKKVKDICPIESDLITTITNGVNLDSFNKDTQITKEEAIKRFGIHYNPGCKYILFVGNLLKAKGVYELLEAFSIISHEKSYVRLVYVGDGPERELLEEMSTEKDLQNMVFFTGRLPHDDVSLLMNTCDIFILPSYSEGMPTVMFEAMASSLPIIISDVGGVGEIIEHGKNGLIIEPGNTEDIVSSLIKILDNPEFPAILGSCAFETVQEYTWEKNAQRMVDVYSGLN